LTAGGLSTGKLGKLRGMELVPLWCRSLTGIRTPEELWLLGTIDHPFNALGRLDIVAFLLVA
jgi:hypothetical protein